MPNYMEDDDRDLSWQKPGKIMLLRRFFFGSLWIRTELRSFVR
jgi:hypothetical protein